MYQIVQKRISDGREKRIGNFVDRSLADEMAQKADMAHRDHVHWVEEEGLSSPDSPGPLTGFKTI